MPVLFVTVNYPFFGKSIFFSFLQSLIEVHTSPQANFQEGAKIHWRTMPRTLVDHIKRKHKNRKWLTTRNTDHTLKKKKKLKASDNKN